MAAATYTKLKSGAWGIRIAGTAKAGDRVTVAKRDGSTKTETIANIVWAGNGVTLVAIASSAPSQSYSSRRMGPGRGRAVAMPGYSSYCTDNASCRCYDCAS